jgi:tRNA-splicing ligase RtcB
MRVLYEKERGQRVPVRVWGRAISAETEAQLQRIASQPYVVEHVAAMADAHVSDGVAVGTVFATEDTVVPGALGGDLGCGMSALRLGADVSIASDRSRLEAIVRDLGRAIPTGAATHRGLRAGEAVPEALFAPALSTRTLEHTREALAGRHLGTLGGGNHFIEIDRDAEGELWLLVHSGSRGLGAAIASHHARVAAPSGEKSLRGLRVDRDEGAAYVRDLTWALDFARANREALVRRALDVIANMVDCRPEDDDRVDIHHNFVARERWLGRDLLIHRKGAVAAGAGVRALIPGSMGTASYIVEGLGNEAAFGSCSHGAGRVMSRKQARSDIAPRALASAMRRVVYPEALARSLVEEAPQAYRDITEVLEDQEDLVKRRVRLEPVAVLKG